jgi:hypothetical protein
MSASDFEGNQRNAQRHLEVRHLVNIGRHLVSLFNTTRSPGTYQLTRGDSMWVQTTHTLTSLAYRLPDRMEIWAEAHWQRKPLQAQTLPVGFTSTTTTLAFWLFAQVADDLHLVGEYRKQPLWLAQLPDFPMRYVKDRQLALMSILLATPMSLEELKVQHPEQGPRLECDLQSLVWSGHLKLLPDD